MSFENELNRLEAAFMRIREDHLSSKINIDQTWKLLSMEYPLVSKLALALLVLPYSTVSVERLFAEISDFKTPKRNRMTIENLEACLIVYQDSRESSNFITDTMIYRYKDMWKIQTARISPQTLEGLNEKKEKKSELKFLNATEKQVLRSFFERAVVLANDTSESEEEQQESEDSEEEKVDRNQAIQKEKEFYLLDVIQDENQVAPSGKGEIILYKCKPEENIQAHNKEPLVGEEGKDDRTSELKEKYMEVEESGGRKTKMKQKSKRPNQRSQRLDRQTDLPNKKIR